MNTLDSNNKRSGGEILIDGLISHGAEKIFCVPGESYLAALDALYDRQHLIQVITCRQEGGASYMAEAYGKLTGKPGICFVSRGPGASNAMIGIHTAFQDSTPLLLFIGQIARVDVGREAFQELDYKQVYSGVAKKVITFSDAGRIPEQLGQAWQIATSGRPGPVIVELPEDMLTDQTDVADLVPGELVHSSPSPASIEKLSDWLGKSESPIVHSHYVGELGIAPNPRLLDRVQAADLIIAVGPRLGDMTTSGYSIFDVPDRKNQKNGQKLVHAHVSAEEINAVYRADLGIVSHPEQFLKALSELPRSQIDRSESIRDGNRNYLDYLTEPRNIDASLRMDKVAELLRKRLPADAIVTNGAGNYSIWAQRHYQFRQPGTQLASTNGSMGYGVPSAIAAKLVRPDSTVISFSGDGCFLMNGQELATAVQYRLNVIFLVVNNQSYGTIRAHQQRHYPHRPVATALQNPNFAALAEAYGAFGAVVSETDQFESAFEAALNAERPALIELQTDY
jgi:acetolactate synthase-1/2/3 large subunit